MLETPAHKTCGGFVTWVVLCVNPRFATCGVVRTLIMLERLDIGRNLGHCILFWLAAVAAPTMHKARSVPAITIPGPTWGGDGTNARGTKSKQKSDSTGALGGELLKMWPVDGDANFLKQPVNSVNKLYMWTTEGPPVRGLGMGKSLSMWNTGVSEQAQMARFGFNMSEGAQVGWHNIYGLYEDHADWENDFVTPLTIPWPVPVLQVSMLK